MREIIPLTLQSQVPVITYVATPGAHAASARNYVLYASYVAAMVPDTNLGAATPVAFGGVPEGLPGRPPAEEQGKDQESSGGQGRSPTAPKTALEAKATNDTAALILSQAELHSRNAGWAERAVSQAKCLSATRALELNAIDLVAAGLIALLRDADGRSVVTGETRRQVFTSGLPVKRIEMGMIIRILSVLSNPNVALVLFTLGQFTRVCGPGLVLIIPVVQQLVQTNLRMFVEDVPSQDVISRDKVSVKVNAVTYFRIADPQRAIINVADFRAAVSQLAQTTLRSVLGQHELDEMPAERDKLDAETQEIPDRQTDAWGIKVANVEIKHVGIDESMVRSIAKQA